MPRRRTAVNHDGMAVTDIFDRFLRDCLFFLDIPFLAESIGNGRHFLLKKAGTPMSPERKPGCGKFIEAAPDRGSACVVTFCRLDSRKNPQALQIIQYLLNAFFFHGNPSPEDTE